MPSELLISDRPTVNPCRFDTEIRDEVCAMQFHTDREANRKAAILGGVKAGAVDVLRFAGAGVQGGTRSSDNIRIDGADYYLVCVPEFAGISVRHNGTTAELHPGTFAFVSTSRPFQARIRPLDDDRSFSTLYVRVPGPLLRRRIPNIMELCGHALELHPGPGRMMQSLFEIALGDGPYLSEDALRQFGEVLFDAICTVALSVSDGIARRPDPHLALRRVFEKATGFIACRLADTSLGPAQIAEHCGVSQRYLHAAFATLSSVTVSSFIRESRLQGCRAALQNPAMRNWTITRIAGDWGFDDSSHFCHVYKSRFGKTPRQERLTDATSETAA